MKIAKLNIRDAIIILCLLSNFSILLYTHYAVASVSTFTSTAKSLAANPTAALVSSIISIATLFLNGILFAYLVCFYLTIRDNKFIAKMFTTCFVIVFLIFNLAQFYLVGVM